MLNIDKMDELKKRVLDKAVKPDVIMVSEVRLKNFEKRLQPVEFKLEGYEIEHKNLDVELGRGLITYVRKGIYYRVIDDLPSYNEYIAIELKSAEGEHIIFTNLYRSGSTDHDNNMKLLELMKCIKSSTRFKHSIISLNINKSVQINFQGVVLLFTKIE